MPEFILDRGAKATEFKNLDSFLQGYIEAMFFTECHADNPKLDGASFDQLAPEALAAANEDCTAFNLMADAWLDKAYQHGDMSYDMHRAGVDFWFTRNRHGAGFWDRGLGAAGEKLSDFAHTFGDVDVYRGDDGMVYTS